MQPKYIAGFSNLSNDQKLRLMAEQLGKNANDFQILQRFKLSNNDLQKKIEEISENVISNYFLPYSVAPNFLVNGNVHFVPMVIEESSVVAAASAAAKFWFNKGGFNSIVLSTTKIGQIHFKWHGEPSLLIKSFNEIQDALLESSNPLLANMKKRNGGVTGFEFINFTNEIPGYYQLRVSFETADAMGANIINSVLEEMGKTLVHYIDLNFDGNSKHCEVIMAILSNHTPESIVECKVECPIDDLAEISGSLTPKEFASKFKMAVDIANIDIYRATTHNKGIYNGIDAIVLATGNDFRAIEACGHSYASKDGHYKSLTTAEVTESSFSYTLKVPMALGTVGGLTTLHPLAKLSLEILGNPSARELMEITAAAGLANTFSAVRALITSGIQKGHMRFHLNNILNSLNASNDQKEKATLHFMDKKISFKAVQEYISSV
jgi:hydroxymethylglutaryl-CoA reductase